MCKSVRSAPSVDKWGQQLSADTVLIVSKFVTFVLCFQIDYRPVKFPKCKNIVVFTVFRKTGACL